MIENLKLIHVNPNTIDTIINEFDYDLSLNMACNYELINSNIDLLKSFGIEDIDTLLLYKIDIFFIQTDELKEKINKYDNEYFIKLINEDKSVIDEIFN